MVSYLESVVSLYLALFRIQIIWLDQFGISPSLKSCTSVKLHFCLAKAAGDRLGRSVRVSRRCQYDVTTFNVQRFESASLSVSKSNFSGSTSKPSLKYRKTQVRHGRTSSNSNFVITFKFNILTMTWIFCTIEVARISTYF